MFILKVYALVVVFLMFESLKIKNLNDIMKHK